MLVYHPHPIAASPSNLYVISTIILKPQSILNSSGGPRHIAMLILTLFGGLVCLALIFRWKSRIQQGYADRISDPELCRRLIRGELTEGVRKNQLSFLDSRARPNQRLQTVFGVNNAFTCTDSQVAEAFVRKASQRMNLDSADWAKVSHALVDTAKQLIFVGFGTGGFVPDSTPSGPHGTRGALRVSITSLVQVLSLKAVLMTVCKSEAKDCTDNLAILQLAQQINLGWMQSKKRGDNADMVAFEHGVLQDSLVAVFGRQGSNPLNFVLPSFETTWRVVFRALLEIMFRSGCEYKEWAEAMIAFCRTATKAQFERRVGLEGQSPSAKDIVMEALRVYPPTRRIYRAYQWDGPSPSPEAGAQPESSTASSPNVTIAADIEACHLRPDTWGPSAAKFDPARWMRLTPEQTSAFMPFGCRPSECPAKAVFGPRMVGVLVGALLLVLDDGRQEGLKWTLECADDQVMKGLDSKERLSLERDAYEGLELCGTD